MADGEPGDRPLTRRTHIPRTLAFLVVTAGLALPASASASTPATLYQANLAGSLTFQSVQSGNDGSWTTTASFPLNGTTEPGASNPDGTNPADTDLWIPQGSVGATQTISAVVDSDFNITAADPNSSLSTVGSDPTPLTWDCTGYKIDNSLDPNIGVITTASGSTSILVDYLGSAYPDDPASNGNTFPASCDTDATFGMQTPLVGGDGPDSGSPQFDIPWAAGYDTIRFSYDGISTTAASQTLSGTNESETATATGQSDASMSCTNGSGNACTETYQNTSETLTLTKICSGTVTVTDSVVSGTCGSGPAPTPQQAPSHTKITKSKISASKHTASFSFSATGATSYQCALATVPKKGHAKLAYHACKSPKSYSHLKKGKYEFAVRGADSTGTDPHPASKSFKIR